MKLNMDNRNDQVFGFFFSLAVLSNQRLHWAFPFQIHKCGPIHAGVIPKGDEICNADQSWYSILPLFPTIT